MKFFDDEFLRMATTVAKLVDEYRRPLELAAQHAREVERALTQSTAARDLLETYRTLDQGMHRSLAAGFEAELARVPLIHTAKLADHVSRFIDQIVIPNQAVLDQIRLSAANVAAVTGPFSLAESLTELLARFHSLQSDQGLARDEAERSLVDEVRARVASVPLTASTAQFYLSILFALILFLISQHSSVRSDEARRAEHAEIEELIADAIEALGMGSAGEETSAAYLVGRPVTVRERPSSRSGRAMTILYPGQRVVIDDRRGKWARIEYYDRGSCEIRHGWVLKKYLLALSR
ncbi:MAG: SH3 domain-containing protein [Chloroflexi bacterium]|nr:SH3 domain-containing protein [Chloroflexota bacterium]